MPASPLLSHLSLSLSTHSLCCAVRRFCLLALSHSITLVQIWVTGWSSPPFSLLLSVLFFPSLHPKGFLFVLFSSQSDSGRLIKTSVNIFRSIKRNEVWVLGFMKNCLRKGKRIQRNRTNSKTCTKCRDYINYKGQQAACPRWCMKWCTAGEYILLIWCLAENIGTCHEWMGYTEQSLFLLLCASALFFFLTLIPVRGPPICAVQCVLCQGGKSDWKRER